MLGYASRVSLSVFPYGLRPGQGQGSLGLTFQIANFSKYISKTRAKHLPLNTKRAGKGYKKGYGARTEGRVTSIGKFVCIPEKRTELVVPDLTDFKLKAYVQASVKKHITAPTPTL